jgi:hypothetical protein
MSSRPNYSYSVDALDYFSGGVPAGITLCGQLQDLRGLVAAIEDIESVPNPLLEVCFIGAVAYFEAFFKDHLAASINICPALLQGLRQKQLNISIDAADVVSLQRNAIAKIGFLLAENFDFGTPKKINVFYSAAFPVTPFGNADRLKYEQVLNERNLIVHHGGVYTLQYCRQKFANRDLTNQAFYNSLLITKTRLVEVLDFIDDVAAKTCGATAKKLKEFANRSRLTLSPEQLKALGYLASCPGSKDML